MIKIEKNIPIPAEYQRASKYPWRTMEIGDSFYVEVKGGIGGRVSTANKVYAPRKFISRGEEAGYRVWRIE